MKRAGFDFIVRNSVLSSYLESVHGSREEWKKMLTASEIRCQWDPARDIYGNPLKERTIQLGIKGSISEKYVYEWIVRITEITQTVAGIRTAIATNNFNESMLPTELEYPLV